MGDEKKEKGKPQNAGYKDKFWIPRFWDGMGPSAWFSLLVHDHFAVSPIRWAMALILSGLSFVNGIFWAIQSLLYRRRIKETKIEGDPIFVIGHWRSGTTLLHELLVLDDRHTYPDTYTCFAPNHFLVSGWLFKPSLKFLLPKRRPIDNMAAGWDRPQEDEFALCNMGIPSPYLNAAFPNSPLHYPEYLDLRKVPPAGVQRWKDGLLWFLKCLTVDHPKRIVLKSPPHTARVKVLLEMFPKAKFLHIVRDPYVIYPSTINLWKRLYRDQGLQMPNYQGLDEYVFDTLNRMYDAFESDRALIGPGQFCEVRYEDLVAKPIDQMQGVYEQLELGGFDAVRPAMERYFTQQKDYKTNRYEMTPELQAEITRRWSKYIEKYGYAKKNVEGNA
jgi:hypothetical protein